MFLADVSPGKPYRQGGIMRLVVRKMSQREIQA